MRILADENLDGPVVAWLRQEGHDVLWIAEGEPGLPDGGVLDEAEATGRILVTFDQDFGGLVFRGGRRAAGIVLLRLRARSGAELLQLFVDRWPSIETKAEGHFTVVSNTRMRVRPMPDQPV